MIEMKRYRRVALSLAAAMALGGCSLDFDNPNEPTEEDVFSTAEGIRTVAVGLQAEYGDQIGEPIYVTGLVTEEIGAADGTFASYQDVDAGRPLDNTTDIAGAPWRGMYRVVKLSNDLLEVLPAATMPAATKTQISSIAKLHKAMALGNLIMMYERIPLEVGPQSPAFADRAAVLAEILRLLTEARTEIQTLPAATDTSTIPAGGFNLRNTIDAMIARYSLVAGNYNGAIEAAGRVNLGVLSELRYAAPADRNPLNNLWYRSGNAYRMRPEQAFRVNAEANDRRVPFWVRAATVNGGEGQVLDEHAKYSTDTTSIPYYLPDEMRLIQAEAYARTDRLGEAATLVNAVRTQCTPSVVGEPAACLPALAASELDTRDELLAEILKQRGYELYLQNLRWEDLRRFGRPLKYTWNAYPLSECDLNTNAPC
ncbi:MAG TPA: RagB/SusD family nutrient uptake outer membrane protein [Longimicrobium sp.]|jgi:hypothetical protein